MLYVYLAGPIAGKSYAEACAWRQQVASLLDVSICPLSPMRGKDNLSVGGVILSRYGYQGGPLCSDKGIVARDHADVRRADLVLFNLLDDARASIGTLVELGWASELGKPIVVAMHRGGYYDHPFVAETAGFLVESLEEAVDVTHSVLLPFPVLSCRQRAAG